MIKSVQKSMSETWQFAQHKSTHPTLYSAAKYNITSSPYTHDTFLIAHKTQAQQDFCLCVWVTKRSSQLSFCKITLRNFPMRDFVCVCCWVPVVFLSFRFCKFSILWTLLRSTRASAHNYTFDFFEFSWVCVPSVYVYMDNGVSFC